MIDAAILDFAQGYMQSQPQDRQAAINNPDQLVTNLEVDSARRYNLTLLVVDGLVFTDRLLRWSHLPSHFAGNVKYSHSS